VSDEDVDAQVDRLREQFGELVRVDRAAIDGDHVTIDLRAKRSGDDDVHVEDYLYEVGSGSDIPGLDDQLRGKSTGDILEFRTELPLADGTQAESSVKVLVKEVKKKVLPEPSDEWAAEASEFDTLDALRDDLRAQVSRVRLAQARLALSERAIAALVDLVDDAVPEALVESEVRERVHDLAHRLEDRSLTVEQFLRASGQDEEGLLAGLRVGAERSVKADLALRALADAEDLQVSDEELDQYLSSMAAQAGIDSHQVRDRIDRNGRLSAVRSEQRKAKAVTWLLDHVELVDESGKSIDRTALKAQTGTEAQGDESLPPASPDDEVDSVDKEDADMETAK
jgi:trigger factor